MGFYYLPGNYRTTSFHPMIDVIISLLFEKEGEAWGVYRPIVICQWRESDDSIHRIGYSLRICNVFADKATLVGL